MVMKDKETKRSSKESEAYIFGSEIDRYFLHEIFGFIVQGKDDEWLLKNIRYISRDGRSGCVLKKEILDEFKDKIFKSGQPTIDRYYMDRILLFYRMKPIDEWVLGKVPNLSARAYQDYKVRLLDNGSIPNGRLKRQRSGNEIGNSILDTYCLYQIFYFCRMGKEDDWICKYLGLTNSYWGYKEILSDDRKLCRMKFRAYKNFRYLSFMEFKNNQFFVEQILRYRREGRNDQFIQESLLMSPENFEKFKTLLKEEP